MAGHIMVAAEILVDRRFDLANVLCIMTTGVEIATGRWIHGAGNTAFKENSFHIVFRVRYRNRRHQRLRVGMLRVRKQFLSVSQLNNLSQIHNGDAITYVFDYGKIVSNKQIG